MHQHPTSQGTDEAVDEALHAALRRLLAPLAKLAVAKGVTHAALDEWLRQALVREAYGAHPDLAEHRRASRVSAATGLHRREVNRLLELRQQKQPDAPPRSTAAEVFAHWRSAPAYASQPGMRLKRVGPVPSFESLAQEVTRDVHPRTILEELVRLKLATLDAATDTVTLIEASFVPRGDERRMLGFLSANVGDHFDAAVDNVLEGGGKHFEQALFAEGLTAKSVKELRDLTNAQWKSMRAELVPKLEAMIERDAVVHEQGQDATTHRIRLGLFGFEQSVAIDAKGNAKGNAKATKATKTKATTPTTPAKKQSRKTV